MFHRIVFSNEDFIKGAIGLQILYGKGNILGFSFFSSFYSNLFFALYTLFCTSFIQRLKVDPDPVAFFPCYSFDVTAFTSVLSSRVF